MVKSNKQKRNRRAKSRQAQKPQVVSTLVKTPISSIPRVTGTFSGNIERCQVNEYIDSVTIASGLEPGTVLFSILLNPLLWKTRTGGMAKYWQNFRFTDLKFEVVTGAPTIVGGHYAHGVDSEPQALELSGSSMVSYVASLAGFAMAPFSQSSICVAPVQEALRSQKWYKLDATNPDLPDYCQGIYSMIVATVPVGFSGPMAATIWAKGTIEFSGRRLPQYDEKSANIKVSSGQFKYALGAAGSGTYPIPAKVYFDSAGDQWASANLVAGYVYYSTPDDCMTYGDVSTPFGTIPFPYMSRAPEGSVYLYYSLEGALTNNNEDLITDGTPDPAFQLRTVNSGEIVAIKKPAASSLMFRSTTSARGRGGAK